MENVREPLWVLRIFRSGVNPTARNNAVHMHMVVKLLVPSVKYLDNAGNRPEILLGIRKLQKRFGTATVEESIEERLVAVDERIQFMWKSEYHMKVG